MAAFKAAYPQSKASPSSIPSISSRLSNTPKIKALVEEIQQGMRTQFVFLSPLALNEIEALALNAESEKVRLEACKEILDRAGLKPPQQVEISQVGVFGIAETDEIKDLIRRNAEDVVEAEIIQ